MTAYKNLGFDIVDYPNAYNQYHNEITLPLHTSLTDEDVEKLFIKRLVVNPIMISPSQRTSLCCRKVFHCMEGKRSKISDLTTHLSMPLACMELILRVLGIGPGDEVITSAYTYTATASVTCHVILKILLRNTRSTKAYTRLAYSLHNII